MNEFQPPGHGLPRLENIWLNSIFKTGLLFWSDQHALNLYARESQSTFHLVDDCDYDFASTQTMVPKLLGIEDSSRYWSLFMVLDHLIQVDRTIMRVIDVLVDGVIPRGIIDIADYKPSNEVGSETLEQFSECRREYQQQMQSLLDRKVRLRNTVRFSHPWFGPMSAHGWHCLAAVHQRIHGKQARKIAALMGRV